MRTQHKKKNGTKNVKHYRGRYGDVKLRLFIQLFCVWWNREKKKRWTGQNKLMINETIQNECGICVCGIDRGKQPQDNSQ